MELFPEGIIVKGLGGSYQVKLRHPDADTLRENGVEPDEGDTIYCRAKGAFRHEKLTLLVGDKVTLRVDTETAIAGARETEKNKKHTDEARAGVMISDIAERRTELIRPPMSNLDLMFIVAAAAKPEPSPVLIDKMTTVADFKGIEPVVVVTKADLSPETAEKLAGIYRKCGFTVFVEGIGYDCGDIEKFIRDNSDRISAFAGASGVGKSTLMNRLFPSLGLTTGEVSRKTERGRHTTRHVELFPLERQFDGAEGFIADTPGFGMLDFVQFDFYTKDDLPFVFREFEPYIGKCRYTKCSHTKEEGCAILDAVKNGEIPKERHDSYLEFYETLKNKKSWN